MRRGEQHRKVVAEREAQRQLPREVVPVVHQLLEHGELGQGVARIAGRRRGELGDGLELAGDDGLGRQGRSHAVEAAIVEDELGEGGAADLRGQIHQAAAGPTSAGVSLRAGGGSLSAGIGAAAV
jgi:hypothetical protein